MAGFASIKFDLKKVDAALRRAIAKGLSTNSVKNTVTKLAAAEIEKVVDANQDLFRPDRGADGGNSLVGLLGIGKGGSPQTEKYAGSQAAWTLLKPGIREFAGAAKLTSTFRRGSASFGNLTYTIDIERFFGHFKSKYASTKTGDATFDIRWMESLIDGIPTTQLRDYPSSGGEFVFVNSGPNFNKKFSRTGLGVMVSAGKLKIPAQQFTFNGRGRANTFGVLIDEVQKKLSSSNFKNKVKNSIAKSINSGGR